MEELKKMLYGVIWALLSIVIGMMMIVPLAGEDGDVYFESSDKAVGGVEVESYGEETPEVYYEESAPVESEGETDSFTDYLDGGPGTTFSVEVGEIQPTEPENDTVVMTEEVPEQEEPQEPQMQAETLQPEQSAGDVFYFESTDKAVENVEVETYEAEPEPEQPEITVTPAPVTPTATPSEAPPEEPTKPEEPGTPETQRVPVTPTQPSVPEEPTRPEEPQQPQEPQPQEEPEQPEDIVFTDEPNIVLVPEYTDDPAEPEPEITTTTELEKLPKTGDDDGLAMVIFLLSGIALSLIALCHKKSIKDIVSAVPAADAAAAIAPRRGNHVSDMKETMGTVEDGEAGCSNRIALPVPDILARAKGERRKFPGLQGLCFRGGWAASF